MDGSSYVRYVLDRKGLVGDSLGQVQQMKGSFSSMWKGLPNNELSGYLSGDHILIYPFFKLFGENIWGLAIPHIVITVVGFYLLYIICKQYFRTLWGYVITFGIVCFNETLIWYTTEIRFYAVFPTLALATLYLSEQLVNEGRYMSVKKKVGIGAFFVLTIWFHMSGVLILVFPLAYALLGNVRDREIVNNVRAASKFLFVVFLIALPLWVYAQLTAMSTSGDIWGKIFSPQLSGANTYEYIANPFVDPILFLKNVFGNLIGNKKLYFLLLGVFFPFFFNYKDRLKQISFLIVLVFLPLGVIWLHDVIKSYWFIQRQFIWVMPFFALFLGWSWESCYRYVIDRSNRR